MVRGINIILIFLQIIGRRYFPKKVGIFQPKLFLGILNCLIESFAVYIFIMHCFVMFSALTFHHEFLVFVKKIHDISYIRQEIFVVIIVVGRNQYCAGFTINGPHLVLYS